MKREAEGRGKVSSYVDCSPVRWASIRHIGDTARGTGNLMPGTVKTLEVNASGAEISDAMRHVYGEYRETVVDLTPLSFVFS